MLMDVIVLGNLISGYDLDICKCTCPKVKHFFIYFNLQYILFTSDHHHLNYWLSQTKIVQFSICLLHFNSFYLKLLLSQPKIIAL